MRQKYKDKKLTEEYRRDVWIFAIGIFDEAHKAGLFSVTKASPPSPLKPEAAKRFAELKREKFLPPMEHFLMASMNVCDICAKNKTEQWKQELADLVGIYYRAEYLDKVYGNPILN